MSESHVAKQVRLVLEQQCRSIGKDIEASCPAGTGFALFLFDFGEGGNLAYISNASRPTMIKAVEEWLARAKATS